MPKPCLHVTLSFKSRVGADIKLRNLLPLGEKNPTYEIILFGGPITAGFSVDRLLTPAAATAIFCTPQVMRVPCKPLLALHHNILNKLKMYPTTVSPPQCLSSGYASFLRIALQHAVSCPRNFPISSQMSQLWQQEIQKGRV